VSWRGDGSVALMWLIPLRDGVVREDLASINVVLALGQDAVTDNCLA
jgi:hypothetical protein